MTANAKKVQRTHSMSESIVNSQDFSNDSPCIDCEYRGCCDMTCGLLDEFHGKPKIFADEPDSELPF